jgi:uncharacterized RDD family membrane protein YckC
MPGRSVFAAGGDSQPGKGDETRLAPLDALAGPEPIALISDRLATPLLSIPIASSISSQESDARKGPPQSPGFAAGRGVSSRVRSADGTAELPIFVEDSEPEASAKGRPRASPHAAAEPAFRDDTAAPRHDTALLRDQTAPPKSVPPKSVPPKSVPPKSVPPKSVPPSPAAAVARPSQGAPVRSPPRSSAAPRDFTAPPSAPLPRPSAPPAPRAAQARASGPSPALEQTAALHLEELIEAEPRLLGAALDLEATPPPQSAAVPAAEQTIHLKLAGTLRRAAATIADAAVVLALLRGLSLTRVFGPRLADRLPVSPDALAELARDRAAILPLAAAAVLILLLSTLFHGLLGRSPGKLLVGSRVVVRKNGDRPSLLRSGIRAALSLVSLGLIGAGYLWVLVDREKRTLHDLIARTEVVCGRVRIEDAVTGPIDGGSVG